MAWAGGVFSRVRNWAQDKLNLVSPQAALFDQEDDNFATGLNNCVTKDGTNKPSANMDWNGFKLTNMANGTANTDAATYQQAGLVVAKASTTSRVSNTTVADDPELVLALATGTWALDMFIPVWATTGGTGGFQWRLNFSGTATSPAGVSVNGIMNGSGALRLNVGVNASAITYANITTGTGINGTDSLRLTGVVQVTVAGNLSFQ